MKTNRRDAEGLVKLLRAGELTSIWVPDERHETMRESTRARDAARQDLTRKRQQVSSMLLRLGRHYPGIKTWGARHRAWLANQKFVHAEQRLTIEELLLAERQAGERIVRLEQAICAAVADWSLAPVVPALQAMRGIDLVSAVTILAEIGDLSRFENPRQLMAYLGIVPSERSTGESVKRGSITKAGNGRARRVLVEAAWAYRHPPRSATRSRRWSRLRRVQRTVPHAVEERQEIDGGCYRDRARARGLHLGASGPKPASSRAGAPIQDIQRHAVRGGSDRRRRALHEPTRQGPGALCRREKPDPGARSHAARFADKEGPGRNDDARRLQAPWHDDAVRCVSPGGEYSANVGIENSLAGDRARSAGASPSRSSVRSSRLLRPN